MLNHLKASSKISAEPLVLITPNLVLALLECSKVVLIDFKRKKVVKTLQINKDIFGKKA